MGKVKAPDGRLPDGSVQAAPELPAPLIPSSMAKVNAPDGRLPDGSVQAAPEEPAPLIPDLMDLSSSTSTKTFTTNRVSEHSSTSMAVMGAAALVAVAAALTTFRAVQRWNGGAMMINPTCVEV